jgi:hypothetical protein
MRRGLVPLVIAAVGLTACGKSGTTRSTPSARPTSTSPAAADLKAAASTLVDDLAAGKFAEIEDRFDVTMKAQLPAAQLENAWRTYQEMEGAYTAHGTPTEVEKGQIRVEQVPITTASGTGEVRISYHPDGTIAGLFFLKAGAPAP